MKKIILLSFATTLLLLGCSQDKSSALNDKKSVNLGNNNFSWLQGEWIRSNGRGLLVTKENWTLQNDDSFEGLGITLDHGDTIFREKLSFIKNDTSWVLTVYGVNNQPTAFKLKEKTSNSFHVSNPQNKFPTDIKYSINGDTLEALVFNAEEEILFQFVHPSE